MKKLTIAQQAGLEYLAEADKPAEERSINAGRHGSISTPRTNTLVKLAELGLAADDEYYGYQITDAGRAAL